MARKKIIFADRQTDRQTDRQANCLTFFRLLAALQVLSGHAIRHLDIALPAPFIKVIYFFSGVPVFFALSGYLVWFSVERSRDFKNYARRRFWRIYPELWVAVLVEIIVMIFLYGPGDKKGLALFIFGQATVFQFWTPDSLRGYGCGTPNGALWTIGVIVQFYIVVWFLYKVLHGKKIYLWAVCWVGSIIVSIVGNAVLGFFAPEVVQKLFNQTFLRYLWLFAIGCFFAEFQEVFLRLVKRFWWGTLLVAALFYFTGIDLEAGYGVITSFFLFAGVIGFAYRYPGLYRGKDFSYGIYLYHMTVVNAMITGGMRGKSVDIMIVILITCVLSWLSTETIGRISRDRKARV